MAMRTITFERGYARASSHWFHLAAWAEHCRDDFGGAGHRSHSRSRDPPHLQRTRVLMTDAHQERSLTRITPVAGMTAAELERVFKHRD